MARKFDLHWDFPKGPHPLRAERQEQQQLLESLLTHTAGYSAACVEHGKPTACALGTDRFDLDSVSQDLASMLDHILQAADILELGMCNNYAIRSNRRTLLIQLANAKVPDPNLPSNHPHKDNPQDAATQDNAKDNPHGNFICLWLPPTEAIWKGRYQLTRMMRRFF